MKRLVLIDGNAILHRAYHALPPLTAPDGTIVNAVYGFISMLLKITTDLSPSAIAVAFDRPAPTFRKELFTAYQATRPKMDDDLSSQIVIVHEVVAAFGIAMFEMDGFEADDVIGTLARQAVTNGFDQVIIVTGDRDLLQLVDEHTFVYMPVKGLSEAKLYGEEEVKERLGVGPTQIPDYKALAGDASDNYPGVAGVGPKTTISLIGEFGSVEGVYTALDKHDPRVTTLPEKLVQKLLAGRDSASLSKDLATVRINAPVTLDVPEKLELDRPEARAILDKLHFHSLLKRLSQGSSGVIAENQPKKSAKKSQREKNEEQLSLV